LKADVARFDSFQYRSLRRLLLARFRAIEHISYASIIHICRSTGVDIMPISIMISKRRLSYFGQVCRMDSAYRLPKIMLHSQLLGDTGSLSRGRAKIIVALIHLSGKCYWILRQIELGGGKW